MSQVQGTSERYLIFSLGNENYAVDLPVVKEVIANTETTRIPHAPEYFLGIMNLRGQVISIIDLRKKFNMKNYENTSETAIVILDISSACIGVVVDSVNSVVSFNKDDISQTPEMNTKIDESVFKGVAHLNDDLVLLLDIEMALDLEKIKSFREQSDLQTA